MLVSNMFVNNIVVLERGRISGASGLDWVGEKNEVNLHIFKKFKKLFAFW